ncbi:MAG: STAS domain-containing protein [Candidatus Riflebacteria bacterium]|nr:STAS domain-containing protein [Candidatus Riflebacteria bacterium]
MSVGEEASRIPIVRVRQCLLVTIQAALSDRQVVQLHEDVGLAIRSSAAEALILDMTGIDVMDSFIATVVRDISLTGHLMGVDTVVTGIKPMIAVTLVEMGLELRGVTTVRDPDTALDMLDRRLKGRAQSDVDLLSSLVEPAETGPCQMEDQPDVDLLAVLDSPDPLQRRDRIQGMHEPGERITSGRKVSGSTTTDSHRPTSRSFSPVWPVACACTSEIRRHTLGA